ncbi:hypothetical protein JDN40_14335 [Rhodomicrobium vannielii ATCC 17100]|uniref:hypothetical protein n=1 Tax=Rhodomicrobium vannielii TaxID=1069 RepID=UPI00191ADA4A|nr:hypothetical protein [Rhodomicrobium vannielii]MBJ7535286.1 hypothetical protein [Rhodomicrobium vannielii ATCC 17100]
MTTRIAIINQALSRIGAKPLSSEDDALAPSYIFTYDSVIGSLCSVYPWSFQLTFRQLAQVASPPASLWKYAHQLPADMAGVPRALYSSRDERQNPLATFEIMERLIYSDEPELWCRYVFTPKPANWPGYFSELASLALAAEYALTVREDNDLRRKLRADIYDGGMLEQAKMTDASGTGPKIVRLGINPLTAVRY